MAPRTTRLERTRSSGRRPGDQEGTVDMAVANLAMRFLVELLGAGFVGYWAFTATDTGAVRYVLAGLAMLAFIGFWGLVLAPRTDSGLSTAEKNVLGTVVLLFAAGTLAWSGLATIALGYTLIVLTNVALMFAFSADSDRVLADLARR
jgi:hypothetical protein